MLQNGNVVKISFASTKEVKA